MKTTLDFVKIENDSLDVLYFIDGAIQHAIENRCSDIHIEPFQSYFQIRMRIDGDLIRLGQWDKKYFSQILTRIKILSHLDIAEKRLPQDGHLTYEPDGTDIRVSFIPCIHGEKIVLRILSKDRFKDDIRNLSFHSQSSEALQSIIKRTGGLLLVSGPTNSGKSTTLYSLLMNLNKQEVNIITVEDPVEYQINGITQIQTHEKAGLTFAKGLRSILRADPDIIMIGEIRDSETARIAVRAAITGHFVASTIHNFDALSSVVRLKDMGIEPYLIASSLIGLHSQRLIRKLCPHCSKSMSLNLNEWAFIKANIDPTKDNARAPVGCDRCHNGFLGRIAVSETFVVDEKMIDAIRQDADVDDLKRLDSVSGVKTMLEDGIERVLCGELYYYDVMKFLAIP